MKKYIPYLIIAILIFFLYKECNRPTETIVEVVTIPEVTIKHDTIYYPKPFIIKEVDSTLKKIDSSYYYKYMDARDQREKDSLFISSITQNEYITEFEDSLSIVQVYSQTRGELLKQSIVNTVKKKEIKIEYDIESKSQFFFGIEPGLNIIDISKGGNLTGKLLYHQSGTNSVYSAGFDIKGNFYIGYYIKL